MSKSAVWKNSDFQREMSKRSHAKRLTSEKRCIQTAHVSGERCKRWAKPGNSRCPMHLQAFGKKHARRFDSMSRYAKSMGKTLTQRVAELQSADHPVQSLRDELDLSRALAVDCVALYEAACETPDEKEREKNKAWASELMKSALNNVRDMAIAYTKIEKEFGAAMSLEQTQILVSKFAQLMDRALRESVNKGQMADDEAKRICIRMQELVEERLVVSNQPHGTTLTPDQDMRDMIDSVPRFEGGEGGLT